MRFALHYLRLSRQKHMILEKMMKWAFYYLSLGKEIIFVLIWVAVQKYLFFDTLQSFHSSPQFASTNELTGYGVALAKACAAVINFNSALLVVSMCQISITALQASPLGRIIPFEKYRVAHRMASCSIVTYSLVHTAAHYYNYAQIPTNWLALAFKTGPGLTGHGLWLCLLTIGGTSLFKCVRKSSFEVFWYTHYLSLVFLLLLNFHGAFCFIKRDFNPQCPGARSWRWLVGPCTLFMVELAIREWRSHRFTFISKVVVHQANVIEIQLKKPSFVFKPGQYVQLNCPEISFVQWHPFTVTSAPEEGFISVHVKMVGCWTKKLGALLGVQFKEGVNGYTAPAQFPQIFIDGPYGSVSESFDRFDVAICIGAGIGQTPFASILKSMWYSITHPTQQAKLKRIVYYGLSREVQVSYMVFKRILYFFSRCRGFWIC